MTPQRFTMETTRMITSTKKISGIYTITNKTNNKVYVGQSINVYDRFNRHKSALNRQVHDNDYLQQSWNKYGEDNFEFKLVKACKPKYLDRFEKLLIRTMNLNDRSTGYNISGGGQGSIIISEETRKKLSECGKRGFKGRHHTEENKRYISKLSRERWKNPEYRNNLLNKLNSPENVKRNSQAMKDKWKDPTFRDKAIAAVTGENNSMKNPEVVRKNSISNSKTHTTTGFYRVQRISDKSVKQGYAFMYKYYEDGKRVRYQNKDLMKLKERIESLGLEWFIIDEEKARRTLNKEGINYESNKQ